VKARSAVTVTRRGVERLRTEPPLALREVADSVYLVGSAGGPLGGDDLGLDIDVGPGASLVVTGVAATVARPGPAPTAPSAWRVAATVAAGGSLDGRLPPTVLAAGCDHHMSAVIDLDVGAALRWREMVVRGRYGEQPGTGSALLRVTIVGRPLVHHALSLHRASVGDARVVGMVAVVVPAWGEGAPPARSAGDQAWWLPADGPGGCIVGLGDEVEEVEVVLADQCNRLPFGPDWPL
jgi:urease accessory protein